MDGDLHIANLEEGHHYAMVKLTCPRSTSRRHGTHWDLNFGRRIHIPHRVPRYHGPMK